MAMGTGRASAIISAMLLAMLSAMLSAAPARAQDPPSGFRTPSNNIFCQFFAETSAPADAVMRCDLAQIAVRPPRPRDCDLEWGEAFEISGRAGAGALLCHGDTVRDDALPALPYGQVFQRQGLTCISEPSGVTCVNAKGHGFEISRARQRVF